MRSTPNCVLHGMLAAVLSVVGCSSEGPDVVPVSGTVTRGGQPVANLFLNFIPAEGRPSWGVTDKDGKFKLSYSREEDGARVARHKVWVEYKPGSPQEEMDMLSGKAKRPEALAEILDKYGQHSSLLEIDVSKPEANLEIKLD